VPSGYDQHISDARPIAARCAVLTLSDTRTADTDRSGRRIRELLESDGHAVAHYRILPDEPGELSAELQSVLPRPDVDAVLTNGGTGISRRDQTVAVIENVIDLPLPGFGELFRMLSWEQIGSGAMLSRALGGVARGKLLFAMPGSTAAVELAMTRLVLPELRHLLGELRK
jgi:molybdenum cofactor biosynthesis protein B